MRSSQPPIAKKEDAVAINLCRAGRHLSLSLVPTKQCKLMILVPGGREYEGFVVCIVHGPLLLRAPSSDLVRTTTR